MRAPRLFRTNQIGSTRLEALTDGVCSVAMTLLILDVKLPEDAKSDVELWRDLNGILPALAAWVVSFAFVLTFWVSHHYLMASLKTADRGILWLNGLFLLSIALIPFPTRLVGQYPGFAMPHATLSAVMLMTSLSFTAMRAYASFHARLLREHIDSAQIRRAMIQSAAAPALYALAIVFSFFWPPAAIAAQVAVLALFFARAPAQHTPAAEEPRPMEH